MSIRFIVTVISNLQLLKQHMVGPLNFDDPDVKKWSLQIYDVVTEGDFSPWVNDLTADESWSQLIWRARLCDNLLDFFGHHFLRSLRGAQDDFQRRQRSISIWMERLGHHCGANFQSL